LPPQDDNGHGTHCAGLVGARGNNALKVTGAAWNIKIMSLKFLDRDSYGTDADAIACLEYAIKMKKRGVNLRVISNSWAGSLDSPALKAQFQLAESAGILNICAAGNYGNGSEGSNIDTSPQYPAAYSLNSIVSVAASNRDDAVAFFPTTAPRASIWWRRARHPVAGTRWRRNHHVGLFDGDPHRSGRGGADRQP
jgi:subtilisin family serine protease